MAEERLKGRAPARQGSTNQPPSADMQRLFIIAGALLLLTGLLWPWVGRLPLGRLPGDLLIDRPGLRVFIPLTSMVIVSLAVSAILWLLRR
jgi:hypothetical protein